jgi:hypothetical protein
MGKEAMRVAVKTSPWWKVKPLKLPYLSELGGLDSRLFRHEEQSVK